MLFIHLFTDFMKHDHNKKKKIVILGRKEKVGACIFGIFFSPPWKGRKSGSLHLWNLFFPLLGREEKVGVDPPPSPITPASYREIFKYWV